MKKIITLLTLCLTFNIAISQNSDNSISGEFGYSRNGSGDVSGFMYGFNYSHALNKTFDLVFAFKGTLNDAEDRPFIWEGPGGRTYDSTLHYVIAGMQVNAGVNLNLINTNHHKFGLNPDLILRYQATSLFDEQTIIYEPLTNLPYPIRFLIRNEPGRTLSVGGSAGLFYEYTFSSKFFIGLNPGIQFDTNGDTIIFATISLGKRF